MGGIKTVADLIPRKSDASAHLLALWRGVKRQPISELVSSRSQQVRASERAPAAYIIVTQRDTSGYGPTGMLSGGKQWPLTSLSSACHPAVHTAYCCIQCSIVGCACTVTEQFSPACNVMTFARRRHRTWQHRIWSSSIVSWLFYTLKHNPLYNVIYCYIQIIWHLWLLLSLLLLSLFLITPKMAAHRGLIGLRIGT